MTTTTRLLISGGIALALPLLVWMPICVRLARKKGRNTTVAAVFAFFFGLITTIVYLLLPDRVPVRVDRPQLQMGLGQGLLKGLGVTLKTMLKPAMTVQYPHVKPDLPARTRGVIALKEENCTVCYKCARECPDWCIYIDAHKEAHEPAGGGRARSAKILDRFAIDYALCMYCGICVEVCPFDALFWSPEFEYAEYGVDELLHEKERLEEWTYTVLPPPALETGAEPAEEAS